MSIAADDANAFKACDANEDGRISIKDATLVQSTSLAVTKQAMSVYRFLLNN